MLVLHYHPFASYCQKALVALYELDVPFDRHLVEGEEGRAEHVRLWPMGGMPVLVDPEAGEVLPESSIVMEYVDAFAAERPRLLPATGGPRSRSGAGTASSTRTSRPRCRRSSPTACAPRTRAIRPASRRRGARSTPPTASCRSTSPGATAGSPRDDFSLADCSAAPALFYGRAVHGWDADAHPAITAYYRRLVARPSVRRVVDEARPYRELFPLPWPADMDALDPSEPPPGAAT